MKSWVIGSLKAKLANLCQRRDEQIAAMPSQKNVIVERLGDEFLNHAHQILRKWKPGRDVRAFCYKHMKQCRVFPSAGDVDSGIWMDASGSTCVAWSAAGDGFGWVHESALPCIAWAHMLRHAAPDLVLHECVPNFPCRDLARFFGKGFGCSTATVSPSDFGCPTGRPRRYSLLANKSTMLTMKSFSRSSLSACAFRTLVASSRMYVRASQLQTSQHVEALAARRGLSSKPSSSESWSCASVLTASEAGRLEAYVDAAQQLHEAGTAAEYYVVDISQNCDYRGLPAPFKINTLLKNTQLYLLIPGKMNESRLMIPEEYLAIQGFPIALGKGHKYHACFPFPSVLTSLSERVVRSTAGNSMHFVVVGSLLLFALASNERSR